MVHEPTYNEQIEQLLEPYGLRYDGPLGRFLDGLDERLLAALLMENQEMAGRLPDQFTVDVDVSADGEDSGDYHTEELTATSEWQDLDLGFRANSWDVRQFDDSIRVAWADPNQQDNASIPYAQQEAPVLGIPQSASKIWYRADDGASGDVTFRMEAFK